MQLVIHILFFLAVVASLIQISLWQWYARAILSVAIGLLAYFLYPWIIEQSNTQLETWFTDAVFMQNLATIQTAEALFFLVISLVLIGKFFEQKIKRYIQILHFFPGMMIIAALIYCEIQFFYQFSIWEFDRLALVYSLLINISFVFVPFIISKIVHEADLRMELQYLIHFAQVFIAMAITVFYQKIPYRGSKVAFDLHALVFIITMCLTVFIAGMFIHRFQLNRQIKRYGNTQ